MPALGVHATEGFRVHITDRTDDDFGLGFGAHVRDSTRGIRYPEIERMPSMAAREGMEDLDNDLRGSCADEYDHSS